ncbi:MAG: metallophosphoesterase [Planctomycetes bacterium]|nr:metallophosphoesterase [Planctomycetota bacterium]
MSDSSFLVMTDTHFLIPGQGRARAEVNIGDEYTYWWNNCLFKMTEELGEAIVAKVNEVNPDFVIHCGDLTDTGDQASFDRAQSLLERFPCPTYFVPGNHDSYQKDARAYMAGLFENDNGKFYRIRHIGGVRFIFLDNAYWIAPDGSESEEKRNVEGINIGINREQIEWLRQELSANDTDPSIVVLHVPLHSSQEIAIGSYPGRPEMAEKGVYAEEVLGYCSGYQEVLDILEQSPSVKAVISGHWHIFDVTKKKGILHCTGGSMIENPFAMRYGSISDTEIKMSTVALDDPTFSELSIKAARKNNFTVGQDKDRDFIIPLN